MPGEPKRVCRTLCFVWCVWMGLPGCERASAPQPAPLAAVKDQAGERRAKPPAQVPKVVSEPTTALPAAIPSPPEPPQPVFRPADQRPRHDEARLEEAGIHVFESKRLKLYTDIEPRLARELPALVDQIYVALEASLGPLPPDRAGKDFQISGFLIRDLALFRELDLVPDDLILEHGRHLRNEFWMREQVTDYYRRHLLFHEATHCFMTYLPDVNAPVWYLEGMAELFASHQLDEQQHARFCVMPTSPREFLGFGRILTIGEDVADGKGKSIAEIFAFEPREFRSIGHYGWSWALCAFLDGTPDYHKRFQQLGGLTHGNQFRQTANEFFGPTQRDIATEWTLFSHHLQYGYDLARAAIHFQPGTPFSNGEDERTASVQADRGWQSSQIRLEAGKQYTVTAKGQFTLAEQPKPWLSEPQGVSIRYFGGHPIGMLLGCLRTEEGPAGGNDEPMLRVIPLGREARFEASQTGTLYLRLNDAWNSLADNQGHADVVIRRVLSP